MKFTNLSNFQKEQYTNYLESQLQKFSSFMLHQRKQNERYKILEDAITYQSQMINKITQRLELLEIYEDRNKQSYSQIHKKYSKIDDIESRLGKIQIGVGKMMKEKWSNQREIKNWGQNIELKTDRPYEREKQDKSYRNIIKRQQQQSSSREKSTKSSRKNSTQSILDMQNRKDNQQKIGKKQLRKLQKKISAMLKQKFEDISLLMQKKSRKRIIPSAQTSQLSIIENYHIRQPKQNVNSFRMDDSFSKKSEQSTFMNNTQSTTKMQSRLNKEKKESKNPKDQRSKRNISRSKSSKRSRSMSKSGVNNEQNQLQKRQKRRDPGKKAKNNGQDSFSLSEYSRSSLSRSKSPLENNVSKISKRRQNSRSYSSKDNEISRSKSSKISRKNDPNRHLDTNPSFCHLKCKKITSSKPYSKAKQNEKMDSTAALKRKVKKYIKQR